MSISSLINQMLTLLIFLIVGVVAYKTKVIDENGNKVFTKVTLNIFQPAMILSAVMRTDLAYSAGQLAGMLLSTVAAYVIMIGAAYLFAPLFVRKKADRGVFRFLLCFGNVGFMGFSVIASLFDDSAVFLAAIFNITFNLLAYSLGVYMIAEGQEGIKIDIKTLITPAFVSTVLALVIFLTQIRVPDIIYKACDSIGDMIVPSSMIIVGVSLAGRSLKSFFADWRIYVMSVIRLFVMPCLVFFICRLFVRDELLLGVMTVLAAMPAAVVSSLLSIQYGRDEAIAGRGVSVTTLLSVVTVPLVVYLLLL